MFGHGVSETPPSGMAKLARLGPRLAASRRAEAVSRAPAATEVEVWSGALWTAWHHSGEPSLIVGTDGVVLRANAALERIASVQPTIGQPTTTAGRPIDDVVDADTATLCERMLRGEESATSLTVRGRLLSCRRPASSIQITLSRPSIDRPASLVLAFRGSPFVTEGSGLARALGAIGRLAGEFSHDLNNELTVLINYTTVLQRRLGARDDLSKHMKEVQAAAWRSSRLVRRLSQLAPRKRGDLSAVAVERLVTDLVPLLELVLMGSRGLELDLPQQSPPIAVPRGRLEHLLLWAARTARDLPGEDGPLRIRLAASQEPAIGDTSRLELSIGPLPHRDGAEGDGLASAPPSTLEALGSSGVSIADEPLSADTRRLRISIPTQPAP